jgi:EAL domain-containing protein (putative c-di-GMP-specific phosphodiesterase class I)
MLKIDQSFVRDLKLEGESASIIDAIIALSRSLRMTAVAEGVETAEQLLMLQELGCEQAQGYYLSRPVDCQTFGSLLRTWTPQKFLPPTARALAN